MDKYKHIVSRDNRSVATDMIEEIDFLKDISVDTLEKFFNDNNLAIVEESRKKVPFYIRLTLPFAMLVYVILVVTSPFWFIITGNWWYKSFFITNWFSALHF